MKTPVDRKAAVVAVLALAFVVSVCVIVFVTHVEHSPFSRGGPPTNATSAEAPK